MAHAPSARAGKTELLPLQLHTMSDSFILSMVFYVFCGAAAVQLFYLLFFHLRLARYKERSAEGRDLPPVSIIICARNEDTNLKKNLPRILAQDYPVFEVIVVDDNSEDGTMEYLFFLGQKEPRLKRTSTKNSNRMMAGKKFPLTLGLKAASYETVLLTDADCYPASDQWLREMMLGYTPGKEIVLGYGAYEKQPGALNRRIRYETVHSAMNYLSFALAGVPYMGVGRNLSYQKHLFFSSNGFFDHRHLPSGDDDLFINKVANRRNTGIMIRPEAFTISEPKETWEDWREQKTRHLSTARYYRFRHKLWLGLLPVSHILFWLAAPFVFIFMHPWWYIAAGIWILRMVLQRYIYGVCMQRLGEADLKPYIEWYDILQLFYYFRFAKAALVKTRYRWD